MTLRGGQPGNRSYQKGKMWERALKRALAEDERLLPGIARKLLAEALKGEAWAINHIADRLDGKAEQPITGADGGPLQILALTPQLLAALTADELTAFSEALPALKRLGFVGEPSGGDGAAGDFEEGGEPEA